ncbi:WD40 repeat domain-containing serine/threonine-protein kinase [Desulfurivibrio alkaliphilus]|uniref:Serine/threonine protein kinase with WD40 repeats n=1 Tax=Desulfurivibrio alkaliphilus (strain DSM 19089 / UNIQEM U267 / AHT2) TaxID=589865 RepID=D6Z1E3_DESAT|nr:WD40 repeat domain-containing serine/threonine-protein kinase [Desulfurivibrio alkaliphilus]ADH85398.1 serine/threonine protein kinase with WD40 repeats [Desulfurivibrio alkaliphilus AHT 2]
MLNRWLQKINDKVGKRDPSPEQAKDRPATAAPTAEQETGRRPKKAHEVGRPAAKPAPFTPPQLPDWQKEDRVLDNYRIEARLPSGHNVSRAWQCFHLRWKIPLLLETPPAELLQSPAGLKQCLHRAELRVKTGLHPNVAVSYNLRFQHNLPVMISELVAGDTLAAWLADRRCHNPRIALSLAIQFCHGMEHCHALGLTHGDIRPENIFITPGSLLKITGFGLATGSADPSPAAELQAFGRCLQQMFAAAGCQAKGSTASLPPPLRQALQRSQASNSGQGYPGFADLRHDLNRAYRQLFKMSCPYHEAPTLEMRAEVLNNQAVFLLEEGKKQAATRKLMRCLELNDTLPEGVYNELLLRWRLEGSSPARILRRIEANRQYGRPPGGQDLLQELEKAAKLNITGLKSDFGQDHEDGPEFCLVPPPVSLAVYRRGAQRRQVESKIHDHLVNRRYQACFEALLATWRLEGFRKDRFFNRVYEELLLIREKLLPLHGQRFLTLTGHQAPVVALSCIPNSRRIASVGQDGRLLIYNLTGGASPEVVQNNELPISTLVVSPGGKHLAVGTREGGVHLVSPRSGTVLGQEQSHRAPVTALTFSRDGKLLTSGGADGSIIVRRLATGREDGVSLAESGAISALCYPDQGLELISGSEDGLLRHWQSRMRECTATVQAHAGSVYDLAATVAGEHFISTGGDRRVKIWPRRGDEAQHSIKPHHDRIRAVLGLADGRCLASAGDDDLINIISLEGGEKLFCLDGRGGGIRSLAPGPRPHTLLAGRNDGNINVWQLIYQLDFDII